MQEMLPSICSARRHDQALSQALKCDCNLHTGHSISVEDQRSADCMIDRRLINVQ